MAVGGILSNQYTEGMWARRTTQKVSSSFGHFAQQMNNAASAKPREYKVYMKTDDMLYSGGNGSGLSFYIKYAEESTRENPTVIAKGVDEHGKEFEQTIYINDINPRSATVVEMHALEAYLGVDKSGGLSSLPHDPFRGNMGLYDRADFIDMFQNSVRDMNAQGERKLADYYRYSLQMYWDFMREKGKNGPAPADENNPLEQLQKQMQRAGKKPSGAQETKSDSEIVTQPDGSRMLMITTQIGDTETVTNIRLSGPSAFQRDNAKPDLLASEDVRPDRLKNGDVHSAS